MKYSLSGRSFRAGCSITLQALHRTYSRSAKFVASSFINRGLLTADKKITLPHFTVKLHTYYNP
ncbi:MAG TPA: hypothetical protein PK502_00875 [Tenuifilaceae bacterium]|nr:hypothetical protein [Tenuifilaceae bacterium]